MNHLLEAALGYAARGIPICPAHWPRRIPGVASLACSCPRGPVCDRPAKHPLVRHGVKEATTDADRIGRWWQRWPRSTSAWPPASASTPWTSTAPPAWPPRRAAGSGGPAAIRSAGGHGGRWLAPLVPPDGLGNRPPRGLAHVDWRGRGGCVLALPAGTSPVAATDGCAASTRHRCPRSRPPSATDSTPTRQPRPGRPTRPRRPHRPPVRTASVGRRTGRPRPGHPGQRNHTLNRTAFKVYRYVTSGILDDEEVTLAFTTAALAIGLGPVEVGRRLASARTGGLANPRTVPAGPGPSTEEAGP